jgi:CRISPR-associated protein Cas2
MTQARLFLLAYDISSPKRWRRVQRIIKRSCQRSQLSVFLCRSTLARMERMESELRQVMHPRDDRLMIVDLGIAHQADKRVTASNPLSDIAQLGAIVL